MTKSNGSDAQNTDTRNKTQNNETGRGANFLMQKAAEYIAYRNWAVKALLSYSEPVFDDLSLEEVEQLVEENNGPATTYLDENHCVHLGGAIDLLNATTCKDLDPSLLVHSLKLVSLPGSDKKIALYLAIHFDHLDDDWAELEDDEDMLPYSTLSFLLDYLESYPAMDDIKLANRIYTFFVYPSRKATRNHSAISELGRLTLSSVKTDERIFQMTPEFRRVHVIRLYPADGNPAEMFDA